MKREQQILWAMTDLGDDVVDLAEQIRFAKPLWKQLLPVAACVLLLVGAGMQMQHLRPITQEEATLPQQSETIVGTQPETPQQTEPVLPETTAWTWEPETSTCYTLPLENGGYAAVDPNGSILLQVEHGTLSLLTDEATGEILAIGHTENLEDPDVETTITFYDLTGCFLKQISAWSVEVLGDLVLVNHEYDKYSLYRRSDRSLLQGEIWAAWLLGDTVAASPATGEYHMGFWDQSGTLVASVDWGSRVGVCDVWNGRAYYDVYSLEQDAEGNWITVNHGIMDGWGKLLADQVYADAAVLNNGYAACVSDTETLVLDLDTGETVARLPVEYGKVLGAYQNLVLVSCDGSLRTANQAFLWDGTPVTEEVPSISVIDDEGDAEAELLQVYDGTETFYLYPDGTELRRVPGAAESVSSRKAVQILQDGFVALVDLQTGEQITELGKPYTAAIPLWLPMGSGDYTTGLLFASYADENGQVRTDILWEDGTLALEDYAGEPSRYGSAAEAFGVFRVEGGYRQIDGSWLYQELCGLPTVEE